MEYIYSAMLLHAAGKKITDENIKKVLLDIAREEKTHIAEFETLLFKLDPEQVKEHEAGRKEVEELSK